MKKRGVKSRSKIKKKKEITVEANPITRILSSIIDLLIINLIVLGPFKSVLTEFQKINTENLVQNNILSPILYNLFFTMFMLVVAYFTIFEFIIQQTPGKILTGVYVESLKTKDKKPKFYQCLLKNIILIPILPFVVWWFIDIYYMFKSKSKSRLTELLLGMRTVEKKINI